MLGAIHSNIYVYVRRHVRYLRTYLHLICMILTKKNINPFIMSETKKHLNGVEKRKKKDNIIKYVSKLPKITTCFEMTDYLNKTADTSLISKYV